MIKSMIFTQAHERLGHIGHRAREAHQSVGIRAIKYTLIVFLIALAGWTAYKNLELIGEQLDMVDTEQHDALMDIENAIDRTNGVLTAMHDESWKERLTSMKKGKADGQLLAKSLIDLHNSMSAEIHSYTEDHPHLHHEDEDQHYRRICFTVARLIIYELLIFAFIYVIIIDHLIAVLCCSTAMAIDAFMGLFLNDVRAPEEVLLMMIVFLSWSLVLALRQLSVEQLERPTVDEDQEEVV